jgi:hypothetical protein
MDGGELLNGAASTPTNMVALAKQTKSPASAGLFYSGLNRGTHPEIANRSW